MTELIYKLLICHFVGDYVLQTDFLAKTKGENLWHMIAHCFLYTLPFAVAFGIDERIFILMASHFIVDSLKSKWKIIGYVTDQVLHLLLLGVYML